jgi:endonuclease/exonuclease/phosphatase family metal-dependent hydrolase
MKGGSQMKFSFLSWNVRRYTGSPSRLEEADQLITNLNPDIFGLIEFMAKNKIRELMFDRFPEYDFAVTDSKMGIEITVGWRRGKFDQVIWTQRREFRASDINLRPGGLISVNTQGEYYNLLFLHTDSGTGQTDYNNRKKMFKKIWKLEKALKKASPNNKPNLIVLGDLNTMGKGSTISEESEIKKLKKNATNNNMKMLDKDRNFTWHQWGTGPRNDRKKLKVSELPSADKSNLDHVIASNDLNFVATGDDGSAVHVEGWNQKNGVQRVNYLWGLSDHSALYGEVQ